MASRVMTSMSVSSGRRSIAPLATSVTHPSAEDLHTSRKGIKYAHRRAKQRYTAWYFGTWNVRSLVDNTGTINTARSRSEKNRSEDRRIDLVIRELNRYDITVAALQETLWFGKHVYLVGESVVITSGRETPQGHQSGQRGEGVAVVLTGPARDAWRAGGEQWESWGSRIVMVSLGVAGEKTSRLHC